MMINTTPIQHTDSLFLEKAVGSTLPLLTKCDGKIDASPRPWQITPPLKKRKVRQLEDHDSIKLSPVKAKKTITKFNSKKSVRFAPTSRSRTLKKERTNLSPETQRAMWYTNREYAEMEQDCYKNLRAFHLVNGDIARLPPAEYCVRGLEMKTSPHINRLRRLRASITARAVLDEQDYLRRRVGRGCDLVGESMGVVSRRYTQTAQRRARELGLIDSIEANL